MKFRQHRELEEKKPTRYYSSRQEKSVAKAVGGKQTLNSGATMFDKSDVTIGDDKLGWNLECKTCVKDQKSFTMQKAWFDKNIDESIYMKKDHSAVVFNFGPNSKNYYVIDENTFILMKDLLRLYESGQLNIDR